jgi:hypothetical protein
VSNIPILPPTPRNGMLALMLSALAALGMGIGTGVVQALQQSSPSQIVKCIQPQIYTIDQYNRLKIGMSQTEVEFILQTGIEESRSDGEANPCCIPEGEAHPQRAAGDVAISCLS